jgi:hypothetical protein
MGIGVGEGVEVELGVRVGVGEDVIVGVAEWVRVSIAEGVRVGVALRLLSDEHPPTPNTINSNGRTHKVMFHFRMP